MIAPMQLARYTGFTDDEVRNLCDRYEMDYKEVADWYDGYIVSNTIPVNKRKLFRAGEYKEQKYYIYSPLSVVKAIRNDVVANYWNSTESYVALAEYICMDLDGLKDVVALLMDGGRVKVNITTYQNDMTTFSSRDDVLTLLIHLGYLGYDEDTGKVLNYVENMIACLHGCRDVDIGVTLNYFIEYADGVSSYVCADILQGIESRLYDKQGIYDILYMQCLSMEGI